VIVGINITFSRAVSSVRCPSERGRQEHEGIKTAGTFETFGTAIERALYTMTMIYQVAEKL
jgi:hypothetical protein